MQSIARTLKPGEQSICAGEHDQQMGKKISFSHRAFAIVQDACGPRISAVESAFRRLRSAPCRRHPGKRAPVRIVDLLFISFGSS